MAAEIHERPGTRLAGLMAYEGHIAGVGDRIPGKPLRSAAIQWMQAASERDIRGRLPRMVAAARELAELEFINGGGTGSLALSLFGDRWFLLAGAGLAVLATVVATLTTRPAPRPRVSSATPEPART